MVAVGKMPHSLAVVDLNGDKLMDVLVGHDGTNFVSLLTASAGGQFTRQDAVGVESPSAIAATDFNGDGKADLIVADYWVNRLTTYQGACASVGALEVEAPGLKTLRTAPTKYNGYPHLRDAQGRRGETRRSSENIR